MADTPARKVPGPTKDSPSIVMARIGAVTTKKGDKVGEWITVHFNPSSLQLQVSNELKTTRNQQRAQYIAKANAKLTMELQFDTTDTGEDVTTTTRKLQAFIVPAKPGQSPPRQPPPPAVVFEWGRIKFKGIAENYKETIDFFSADGVPLRASVNLTLTRQDHVFDQAAGQSSSGFGNDTALDTPPSSPAAAANAGEDPGAARAVAEANGQENLRFGDGSPLTIDAEISLKPATAFAAGGGLSVGLGIGGGLDAGVGADLGAGLSGLAGLSASEGAFAGLRPTVAATASTARLNTSALVTQARSAVLSTDRDAAFHVGGRAAMEGPSGLRADVGVRGGPGVHLSFED